MGGSINIAARFNNGDTICVDGWTNILPAVICNENTLSGDDSIVRETLMKVASHTNYEGPQPFRANGYGIVVIDFIGKAIHSMQGYTSFNRKLPLQLLDINATGWQGEQYINVLSAEGKSLLDTGRVRIHNPDGPRDGEVLTQASTIEIMDEDFRQTMNAEDKIFWSLIIDTAPFTVHDYDEGGRLITMKSALSEAGFPLRVVDGLNAILRKPRITEES